MKCLFGGLFVLVGCYMVIGINQISVNMERYTLLSWVVVAILYFSLMSLEVFLLKKFKNYKPKIKANKTLDTYDTNNNNNMLSSSVNQAAEEERPIHIGFFKHVSGLPIDENVDCYLYLYTDKIIIQASGYKFNLLKNKIKDVSFKTDVEIQSQYVSSIGGAIAGAHLLGPIGAIIGGRAKQKKSKIKTKYLIFTYDKGGNPNAVGFEVPELAYLSANKFVKDFKKNYKDTVVTETIEL